MIYQWQSLSLSFVIKKTHIFSLQNEFQASTGRFQYSTELTIEVPLEAQRPQPRLPQWRFLVDGYELGWLKGAIYG